MARPRYLLGRLTRDNDDSGAGDNDPAVPDHAKTWLVQYAQAPLGDEFLWLRLQHFSPAPISQRHSPRLGRCRASRWLRFSPHLLAHYAASGASNPDRDCHFYLPRDLERFHGAAHLPERSTALSPLFWPVRFPDSIASARHQRWHRHVNGRLIPYDAAGNRNLLLRPTLFFAGSYADRIEGVAFSASCHSERSRGI